MDVRDGARAGIGVVDRVGGRGGIDFDNNSAMGAKPPGVLGKNVEPVIKWFRTVVELESGFNHNWAEGHSSAIGLYLCCDFMPGLT